jgi:hypothetical protein
LYEQGVNGANLNAVPATSISDFSSVNIILAVRFDERKSSKSFYDAIARLGSSKALQQLLQYKASAEYLISSKECVAQRDNL